MKMKVPQIFKHDEEVILSSDIITQMNLIQMKILKN